MTPNLERFNSSKLVKGIVLALFVIAFLAPRLNNLDRFMATDEGAWLYRSGDFLYALGQRDFDKTYVKFHPGVVTSWAGSAAMLVEFPDYYKLGQGYFEEYQPFEDFLEENGIAPYDVMVTGRLILILFFTLVMTFSLLIMIELAGVIPASVAFFLLAIDPFFIALTRMFHLDAPMAVLILFSLSLYLAHLKCSRRRWLWLALSGAAGGAAGLAKITSALLGPVVILLLVMESVIEIRKGGKPIKQAWRDFGLKALVWGGAALAAVFIFWPTMWVQPIETVKLLLEAASGTTAGTMQTSQVVVEPTIFFFYNPLDKSWMNYIATFVWRTSPVILVGLVSALIAWITSDEQWKKSGLGWVSSRLLVFAVIFLVYMSMAGKQSQKYILPTYLLLLIIAGFGLVCIPGLIRRVWSGKWTNQLGWGFVAAGLIVQVLLMLPHVPYYWTYYNPMMGGSERAGKTIFVGTGEGLDLAGEYLNTEPNADQLTALSWYGTGCLSYFFDGEVISLDHDDRWEKGERVDLAESDYLLIYSNQLFRNQPESLLKALEGTRAEEAHLAAWDRVRAHL